MSLDDEIQQSLKKLNLQDVDWARELTAEEILYLLDHCPFLQIISTSEAAILPKPEFITAKSGWIIHYYGDAMSSSPGPLLFSSGNYHTLLADGDDEGGGDGGLINPGRGTLVKQAFDTAAEMVAFAKKFGWRGVKIVDGHPLMQWAAWMQATDDELPLSGFEPTKKDHEKRERVKRSHVEDQVLQRDMRHQRELRGR